MGWKLTCSARCVDTVLGEGLQLFLTHVLRVEQARETVTGLVESYSASTRLLCEKYCLGLLVG